MSGWVQTPDGRNIDLVWDDERGWHEQEDPAMGFRPAEATPPSTPERLDDVCAKIRNLVAEAYTALDGVNPETYPAWVDLDMAFARIDEAAQDIAAALEEG